MNNEKEIDAIDEIEKRDEKPLELDNEDNPPDVIIDK